MNKDLLPYWINEVERKISTAPVGPVLVTGGPGTGKTRALAYRVAGLVRGDVPPEKIFLLTTNRSLVREMQQGLLRFSEEFHRFVPIEKIRRVRTGTLDILAGDFLLRNRAHIEEGIPDKPRIRQEYTATFFMALYNYEQLTEMGVSTNELEDILHWNTLLRSGYPQDPEIRIPPLWHKVLDVYECYKRDKGVLDSLDLLSKAIETMQRNPDLVDAFHKPSEVHVLVDDFHNVSRAGYKFLQMISRQSGSITVAGDSNCAVGPWPVFGDKLLDRFKAEYPQVQHFQLRFNRRSTPLLGKLASVLATQATMDPMVDQAGQDAFVSCNSGGEMAQLVKVDGDRETMHGRLVDDIIVKKQSGIPFEQMAVNPPQTPQRTCLRHTIKTPEQPSHTLYQDSAQRRWGG